MKDLEDFFTACNKFNLVLLAKASEFYAKKVALCRRIINSKECQLDTKTMEAIKTMTVPINAEELCQLTHCCWWMSMVIPDMDRKIEPLNKILKKAYRNTGKNEKSTLKNVLLSQLSWGAVHVEVLVSIQNILRQIVKRAFPEDEKVICVFTDVSKEFWVSGGRQTDRNQLHKKWFTKSTSLWLSLEESLLSRKEAGRHTRRKLTSFWKPLIGLTI